MLVSGDSGSGKSTLARSALAAFPAELEYMNTFTTRQPRKNEDTVEYTFVDLLAYQKIASQSKRWDESEIYGNFYGTDPDIYIEKLEQGKNLILCIPQSSEEIENLSQIYGKERIRVIRVLGNKALNLSRLHSTRPPSEHSRSLIDAHSVSIDGIVGVEFNPRFEIDTDKRNFNILIGGIIHEQR